jgi:hypothetical protein
MRTLCVSLAVVVMLATTAVGSINAGPTWNQFAAQHHFDRYPVGDNGSFAVHYNGSNLSQDFAAIVSKVNQALGTSIDPEYNDLLDTELENWGNGTGLN